MLPAVTLITATGSYSSPVGCKYLKVFLAGGGGGGAGGSGGGVNGTGGGPGMAAFAYYPPGTYNLTIGAGGAGGAIATAGSTGVGTIFDTANVFDYAEAYPGGGGNIIAPQNGVSAISLGLSFVGVVLANIPSQPGAAVSWDVSGNGGMNSLCPNGRGSYRVTTNLGGLTSVSSGGGGGGQGSAGGAGGAGFVRVIAYF